MPVVAFGAASFTLAAVLPGPVAPAKRPVPPVTVSVVMKTRPSRVCCALPVDEVVSVSPFGPVNVVVNGDGLAPLVVPVAVERHRADLGDLDGAVDREAVAAAEGQRAGALALEQVPSPHPPRRADGECDQCARQSGCDENFRISYPLCCVEDAPPGDLPGSTTPTVRIR